MCKKDKRLKISDNIYDYTGIFGICNGEVVMNFHADKTFIEVFIYS